MHTDPLTAARYPDSTDAPNIAQYIQNAANDLSAVASPNYATTTARNTAFSNWVALGNTMRNGLLCTVADKPYVYSTTSPAGWRPLPRASAGGIASVTLNSTGDVNIAHGLSVTPSTATLNLIGTIGAAQYGVIKQYQSPDATNIFVRITDGRDGTGMAGWTGVLIAWSATLY